MTIGERLRMIRKKEKLLLKQVGGICGITAQTLSRYENNERKPDYDFLGLFVKHFKVSSDWLLFGEPPMYRGAELGRDIIESFIELTDLISSKDVPGMETPGELGYNMHKITGDIPENYLLLIKYMMKNPIIRKGIFNVFYLFLKPLIDKHPELSGQDE